MLSVEALSVHYGRVQAVREVSLAVHRGEIVALLGANGAGKSSLLQAIVGLVPPSAGRIWWQGVQLDRLPAHRVSQAGVALVPEGRQILPTLSVRDNLLLGAYQQLARSPRTLLSSPGWALRQPLLTERLARVFALFPRLDERCAQMAASLSGGEQQMLAIGRALMSAPSLLLLDEPSIGLAPNLVQEILALLARLRDEGLTVLLVEQDAHAALRIADRGYVMETGRIAVEDEARALLASPSIRRAYLGAS
ncbi:MAG: ABC transporter ATP-binding protein [Chloroflexi bacterium]|nr:ABC transporter ATP-binding protein [Chloroflexota bacterium]